MFQMRWFVIRLSLSSVEPTTHCPLFCGWDNASWARNNVSNHFPRSKKKNKCDFDKWKCEKLRRADWNQTRGWTEYGSHEYFRESGGRKVFPKNSTQNIRYSHNDWYFLLFPSFSLSRSTITNQDLTLWPQLKNPFDCNWFNEWERKSICRGGQNNRTKLKH